MSSETRKSVKSCRLCTKGSEVGVAHDLFAKCNKSLLKQIKELTGIRLKDMQRKNLPRNICSKCKEDLSSSYHFRSRVIKSQLFFNSKDYQSTFENISEESKQEDKSAQLFDTVFVPSCVDKLIKEPDTKCSSDKLLAYVSNNYNTAAFDVEVEDEQKIFQPKIRLRLRKSILPNVHINSATKMLDNVAVSIKKLQNYDVEIKPELEVENARQNMASTEFEYVETEFKIEDTQLGELPNCPDFSISEKSTIEDNDDPKDTEFFLTKPQLQIKSSINSEKENVSKSVKENQFHCLICERTFRNNKLLKMHYALEHKGEKKCKLCEKTFLTRKSLETHLRWHTNGEEAYKCRFCDMSFKYANNRTKHERKLHSRDCPFLCSQCGKTFITAYLGKSHMVVHTKERAFHCTVCNASFLLKSHLRTHYRSETHKNNEIKMKEKTLTATTGELELKSQ